EVDEDLRLVFEAAKRGRVDNLVAVALVGGAVRVLGRGMATAAGGRAPARVGGEPGVLARLDAVAELIGHRAPSTPVLRTEQNPCVSSTDAIVARARARLVTE